VTFRRAVAAIVAAVVLAFGVHFGLTFPWRRTLDLLAASDWRLLTAAVLINILSLTAKASAWYLLLRRAAPLTMGTAQAATFVGAAVNSVSLSISGDMVRAQLTGRRDNIPFGAAAASLVMSRVVEALGLIFMLALAVMVFHPWPGARAIGAGVSAGVAVFTAWISWSPSRFRMPASRRWHQSFADFVSLIRRATAPAVALATLSWLGQWLTYQWSIAATHVSISLAASLAALAAANLAGLLRLTPGNIGIMQGSLIVALGGFGVGAADGLAAGLALQAVQVLPILAISSAIAGRSGIRRLARRRSEAT
jgi:uncharacterized membrane protein YbhN (UPF0104 family)